MQNGKLVQDIAVPAIDRSMDSIIKEATTLYGPPVMPTAKDLQDEAADWGKLLKDKERRLSLSDESPSKTASSPKTRDSSHKIPVNLCPASAIIAISIVIAQGHKKPGRSIYNWRSQPISYLDYHAAALRHLLRSIDGHDYDTELSQLASGGYFDDQGKIVGGDRDNNGDFVIQVRHDWAAMSCLAIIEDARQAGTLVDDRPVKGGAEEFLESLMVKK
jgi:hypothetical protein